MKNRPLLFLLVATAWLIPALVMGQPTLSGPLSGTLGPGEYLVVGDCQVEAGATLTLQPGTTFKFTGWFALNVYGQLNADGTAQDSIKFIRQNPTEACKHAGIRFYPGASLNSSLSYCLIEYGKTQSSPYSNGGGIYCMAAGVTVSHCKIQNCASVNGGGIYFYSAPTATVEACIFFNNTASLGGGIYLYNSPVTVRDCILAKNSSTST